MKKIIQILVIISLVISCNTNGNNAKLLKSSYFYPRTTNFSNNSESVNIYLDSLKNYTELIKTIDKIACKGKTPVIKFSNKTSDFNLITFTQCSDLNTIACYSGKNIISIQNDSIIVNSDNQQSINNLDVILENHILNPNENPDFSQSIDKALISFYTDSIYDISKTKETLIKIATKFNGINKRNGDSLPLKIKFNDYPHIKILYVPPPPINEENEW